MKKELAKTLLKKTKSDYDKLALLFQEKRNALTPDMLYLKRFAKNGDNILDLGCGFGRLNDVLKGIKIEYIGTDISPRQIALAKKAFPNKKFLKCSLLKQPFGKNSFDKVFCLSVIHHLPSNYYRLKLLQEIKRILKPSGRLVATVWYPFDNLKVKKVIDKYNHQKSELDKNDIFLPFKDNQGKIVVERYLHCFTKEELRKAIKEAGFKVKDIEILTRDKKGENKNILIVAES